MPSRVKLISLPTTSPVQLLASYCAPKLAVPIKATWGSDVENEVVKAELSELIRRKACVRPLIIWSGLPAVK